jgi:hypothetical protein
MIDHSGHPHPSTPAARALCRANGGTGSIAKSGARSKSTKAPTGSAGTKVSTATPKKAETVTTPKSAAAKVTAKPRVVTDISTGKPISREQAATIMFGTEGAAKKVAVRKKPDTKITSSAVKAAQRSGIGAKLDATPADKDKAARAAAEQQERLKRIIARNTPMTAAKHSQSMGKISSEEGQEKALRAAPVGLDTDGKRGFNSPAEEKAANFYIGSGYGFVNSFLRGQNDGREAQTQETIKQLDAIMDRSKLQEDIGAFRGVANARLMFGDALEGDMTGLRWTEKGYTSTTVNQDVADDFVDHDAEDEADDWAGNGRGVVPVKMRIALPQGTPAFQASSVDDEAELVLGRNSNFRVIKDRGRDNTGVRVIDVELVL